MGATIAHSIHLLSIHPAVRGSCPNYTIYAFTILSQICPIVDFVFALWKEQKRGRVLTHFFLKKKCKEQNFLS